MDRRTDGQTDRQTDRKKDRQIDRQIWIDRIKTKLTEKYMLCRTLRQLETDSHWKKRQGEGDEKEVRIE